MTTMQNLLDDLTEVLQAEQAFISDGEVLKNTVVEAALKLKPRLLELLLQHDSIKEHFFTEVAGTLVFDKVRFQEFVSNKAFLPDSYTAFRNRIGLTYGIGKNYLSQSRDVVLTWPYKDCVLEGGMTAEDRGRDEVFWNTTLAPDDITRLFEPKVMTGWERWDAEAVGKDKVKPVGVVTEDDNLLIKGNNLLALYSLKVRYAGKVKLIYIDPPYNTGNDSFRYNDRFNHSTWLTFIRNRLEVAKVLLAPDGVIIVQINDNEQAYLKVLMDEVFDQNYQSTIVVKMAHLSGVKMAHKNRKIPKTIEYLHVFSSSSLPIKVRPQYVAASWDDALQRYTSFINKHPENPSDITRWMKIPLRKAIEKAGIDSSDEKARLDFLICHADQIFQTVLNRSKNYPKEPNDKFLEIDGVVVFNGREVELASNKIRLIDGIKTPVTSLGDIWTDIGINNVFQEGGKEIDLRFGKKPEMLLERIIRIFTDEGDLVLDFFAGTGTTAAVAHKMRRKWITIEQLDLSSTHTVPRLKNVIAGDETGVSRSTSWKGGGSFVYAELAASNSTLADQIETAQDIPALKDIYSDIRSTGYLRYDLDMSAFDAEDLTELSIDDAKQILMDCLDVNHLYVNLGSLDDAKYDISEEDAAATRSFYGNSE